MKTEDIRKTFLGYFEEQGHEVLPSSSVIPHGDPTLLFTNAGMNQFKDVFTGRVKPSRRRATTVQKCIRAGGKHNDLDNVGYTARHLTLFEMLGNFSFGDYFKKEAIEFAWELLTARFELDSERLWITVYKDDDEARALWKSCVGVPDERIVGLGEKDNYWSMGDVGPCGPCSEILLDRGEAHGCGPDCGIGRCDCDRYFEIWNLVFMQFDQVDGEKVPLERPSIDTGMGLERMAMVLQGVDSIFDTDTLRAIIARVEELTGVPYEGGPGGPGSTPHRVIADHIRSLVFAFADGAEPSNEGRGYVLRRILRRAARYGRKLTESDEPLLAGLVDTVLDEMGDAYPEIRERRGYIEKVIENEEERFGRTLTQGMQRFDDIVEKLRERGAMTISGVEAFQLYDTFGFPVDLTMQMAAEIGMQVDEAGFAVKMKEQQERSKQRSGGLTVVTGGDGGALDVDRYPETNFVGYEASSCETELLDAVQIGERDWRIIVSDTPFYAESGGQVGDVGTLRGDRFGFQIADTQKQRGRWIHLGELVDGDGDAVRSGAILAAQIDGPRREAIERNHTATHLLHAALRQVLGDHVHQKGSLVEAARLRFDVTHFSGLAAEERRQVEEIVEREIAANTVVETLETDYEDAVRRGAMALFGEKYGDRVRVVRIGDFSMELCGGTHVERSGDIGGFALVSEGSVSAGVRRVEALSAAEATRFHLDNARLIEELAAQLRVPPAELLDRVAKLQDELKKARSARGHQKAAPTAPSAISSDRLGDGNEAIELHFGVLDGERDEVLAVYDQLKSRCSRGVFLLLGRADGKLTVVVALSPPLAKEGWNANQIFAAGKEPIGGRGGGRPEMVQGGGTNPAGAEAALQAMVEFVRGRA